MMRTLVLFLLIVLAGCTAQKQGLRYFHLSMLNEADVLFVEEDYYGAAILYNRILEANPAHPLANLRYGVCLLHSRENKKEALTYLERVESADFPEIKYYTGRALHYQERFDDAVLAYERYLESADKAIPEPEVRSEKARTLRAKELYSQPANNRIENLGPEVNSPWPDYVPVVDASGTTLYFTSRRKGGTGGRLDPNGAFFEDIYRSTLVDRRWTPAENIGPPVNTSSHDASVALSPSGNKMLIYRTNDAQTGGDIYITELKAVGWTEPELFSDKLNSRHFEPSACFSPDERSIIFSSNRPGGYGGKDLYRIVLLPDGSWSEPLNLGPSINTSGHEDGPFVSPDGKYLYFSSTSHNSIGGYDIFRAAYNPQTGLFENPESLGFPINTVYDDIYLVTDGSGKSGYYSTNKAGGYGGHDIYRVDFGAPEPKILVQGVMRDNQNNPLRAEIHVYQQDEAGAEPMIFVSNAQTGRYLMVLNPSTRYRVEMNVLDFETLELEMQYEGEWREQITEQNRDFTLTPIHGQSSNEY